MRVDGQVTQPESQNKLTIHNHSNEEKTFKFTSAKSATSEDSQNEACVNNLKQERICFPTNDSAGRQNPEKTLCLKLRSRTKPKILPRNTPQVWESRKRPREVLPLRHKYLERGRASHLYPPGQGEDTK